MPSETNETGPGIPGKRPIEPQRPAGGGRAVLLSLSLVGGLAILAVVLFAISPLAPRPATVQEVAREIVLVDWGEFRPEPRERLLYIAGTLLLPFSLLGSYLGVRRFLGTPFGSLLSGRIAPAAAWLWTALVPFLVVSAALAEDPPKMKVYLPGGPLSVIVALVLAAALAICADRFREKRSRLLTAALAGLAGILLLGILFFSVIGPEHIRNWPIFWVSFNAVFYSVVQVCLGRALLIDFVNQYGLYPHLLEPFLRVVGLGVYSFTVLMGLLTCAAYACFYRFLARETDETLGFLGLATMVFFGYAAFRVASHDLYLQYQPLRILFPALAVIAARSFAHRPTRGRATGLAALGAVALIWNTETGLVVLAAGLLLPAYDALLRRRPRELPARLFLGVAAAAGVFGAFTLYLRLRYGGFPDWPKLLAPAKAFYLAGAFMVPMPFYGLWVPIVVIYAAALLLAAAALVEGEQTPRARLYFFLPVLGLGVFTYYQGRSVLDALMMASYPAILLLALFADDLRRRLSPGVVTAERVLAGTLLFVLVFSLPCLATVAPSWYGSIAEKVRVTREGRADIVMQDAQFLRRFFRPGEKVLIASYTSGLYHALTETTNPLDIPGDSELLYLRDIDKQIAYLDTLPAPAVIDKTTINQGYFEACIRRYPASLRSPSGNLAILRRSP